MVKFLKQFTFVGQIMWLLCSKYVRLYCLTLIVFLSISGFSKLNAQEEQLRPQLWNNLFVGWDITEKISLRGELAYNVLLSDEMPWNEISTAASGVYTFHRFMEANAGLYIAGAKQSQNLRSFEYRPYIGFRLFSNNQKRWVVNNFSRFEIRLFHYSDRTTDIAFRFRNRTYGVVSLNKFSVTDDRNLYLFGYFEAFYNFEQEVRERFFNQFKYKLGFAYRHNYSWRINIGLIYQDAVDNITEPVQLPETINTKWVFEWGLAYIIPVRNTD